MVTVGNEPYINECAIVTATKKDLDFLVQAKIDCGNKKNRANFFQLKKKCACHDETLAN